MTCIYYERVRQFHIVECIFVWFFVHIHDRRKKENVRVVVSFQFALYLKINFRMIVFFAVKVEMCMKCIINFCDGEKLMLK